MEISKTENGPQVASNEISEGASTYTDQQKEVILPNSVLESKSDTFYSARSCRKYLAEGSVDNIHMTFLDPPYR